GWSTRVLVMPVGFCASGNAGMASTTGHRRQSSGRSSAAWADSDRAISAGSGSSLRALRTRGTGIGNGGQLAALPVYRQFTPRSGAGRRPPALVLPDHLAVAVAAGQHAGQHEQQVGEPVEVADRLRTDVLGAGEVTVARSARRTILR